MKRATCLVVISLLVGIAAAQDTNRQQNDSKSPRAMQTQTGTSNQSTQNYKGTLVDASCAGSSTAPAPASTNAPDAAQQPSGSAASKERNNASQGCSVSAGTSQFALKLDDGRTVVFDSVGNLRVQQAIKDKKKWNEAAGSGKPIRAKVSGFMTDDKLMLLSIN